MKIFKSNNQSKTIILSLFLLVLITPVFAHAANWMEEGIYKLVQFFLGTFFVMSGWLLNYALQYTVIDFGANFLGTGLGAAVNSIWVTIRDLFNMTFIFGLVYIGFKMILGSDDSNTKRWLVNLIMAALLVNFSLFFAKIIVDFSNILAAEIITNGFANAGVTSGNNIDVSGTFMNSFGLTSLFGDLPESGSPWALIFGTAIIFITGMFVFAAGAFLLLIRFVSLLLYMIFSPLMFLGWVFPNLQKHTDEYWTKFLGRAFFAPIYVLLLYVSARLIYVLYSNGYKPDFTKATSGNANEIDATFASTFPPFIISAMFLVASVLVASKLGADGAGAVMRAGERFRGGVQNGLRTMGNAATYAPRAKARSYINEAGEKTQRRLNNIQAGNGKLAKIAKWNWVDRATRGTSNKAINAQFGTNTTNQAEKDYKKKTELRANQTAAENNRTTKFKDAQEKLKDTNKSEADLTAALNDLSGVIKEMTQEEKNNLSHDDLKNESIAINLSDNDISGLEKSGNFSAQEISNIKTARKNAQISIANNGNTLPGHKNANVTAASIGTDGTVIPARGIDQRASLFKGKSNVDIAKLPKQVFTDPNMTQYLSPQIINSAINAGTLDGNDLATLKTNIESYAKPLGTNNPNYKAWKKWSTDDVNGIRVNPDLPSSNETTESISASEMSSIREKLKEIKAKNNR